MASGNGIQVTGVVLQLLPNAMFRIQLEDRREVLAHVSDQRGRNFIRILVGDRVRVELSQYDITRGRITYRY